MYDCELLQFFLSVCALFLSFLYLIISSKGVNAALYWDKVDFKEYIALVPTSAHSGDGMGDLISLIVSHSEQYLTETLMFSKEVEAIVLEVLNELKSYCTYYCYL